MAGMQIIVDDLLTAYDLRGEGRLVVLLHGWGDSSKGLLSLSQVLSNRFQILSIDLPGFGGTQSPKPVWGLDNYAIFLHHTIEKLGLPEPYALVGHSNGGAIAIRAIGMKALSPQKLILLASAGIRTGHTSRKVALKATAKAGRLSTAWLPTKYRKALRGKLYAAAGSDMLLLPELEATFKKVIAQDVQRDAAHIAQPTLLIFAQNDQAVPLENGEKLHTLIKGSQLEVLSDAGHFIHLDQREKVSQLIEGFLA
jgi:pimeloyl-ACP methyl ester carboxylesterase